jgi:hypothetical protein
MYYATQDKAKGKSKDKSNLITHVTQRAGLR